MQQQDRRIRGRTGFAVKDVESVYLDGFVCDPRGLGEPLLSGKSRE